ncbi:universal stress protein [Oceanidesulfovibrio indonesiensis]|uniref:Universal stress protein n=1 Tax=Oceanidesulfovibrio indonesiensis TaxID=54767 RepID=A0A7M3MI44_9BACT|nr:universal stress protein [Oceanidesulfovibrio indonesiensis]TVM19289.1 universal stress protein [Oceanidesulfovibrio indonesiensis]
MKILVALDNSDFAKRVLEKALQVAKTTEGATLTAINVVNFTPYFLNVGEMPPDVQKNIRAHADKLTSWAKEQAQAQGLTMDTAVEESYSPADAIVKYAEKNKFDLIVIGHKGASAIERFLVGSVAVNVVSHAHCSVLVVR